MAEKETENKPKDLVEAVPEEVEKIDKVIAEEEKEEASQVDEPKESPDKKAEEEKKEEETKQEVNRGFKRLDKKERDEQEREKALASWIPKTNLGRLVKAGKEKNIEKILSGGKRILEPEIVDILLKPESELILVGQAKGKFGGGKRRAWRQTQKKTKEGNVLSFSSMVVVGDKKEHIGVGFGKAKETLPAREKALRKAKLNITKIQRGFEDPADTLKDDPHTIPFKVEGKAGSVIITLRPAPRGTGLVVADECKKILRLAGVKDVYGRTEGQTKTTFNLAKACVNALTKTTSFEVQK